MANEITIENPEQFVENFDDFVEEMKYDTMEIVGGGGAVRISYEELLTAD
jgi:hypothetical protein